jgi:hypothetical protein
MFRYNAYFGIHTVYFMDLVEQTGRQTLPMGQVVLAALQTLIARGLWRSRDSSDVLNLWTRQLLNKLDNLKYLSYIGADGFPVIIPVIQAQAADAERILFSTGAFREELRVVPSGVPVAVFGMSLEMEDVLLRGQFEGIHRIGGVCCGSVRVDWVYNPMPPTPQQIYPPIPLERITVF